MEQALASGAGMINDVSALTWDPRALEVVARAGCPVVLMHHQGPPETMQDDPRYDRPVILEIYDWLEERIVACEAAGIGRERIIVDPGYGFGKNVTHNLQLMNNLALLHGLTAARSCSVRAGSGRSGRAVKRGRPTGGCPARWPCAAGGGAGCPAAARP